MDNEKSSGQKPKGLNSLELAGRQSISIQGNGATRVEKVGFYLSSNIFMGI